MFQHLFFAFSFFAICSAQYLRTRVLTDYNDSNEWILFGDFQEKYKKRYNSLLELERRFEIFRSNLHDIFIHNSNMSHMFTLGINKFSDLTSDEFRNIYLGGYSQNISMGSGCGSFSSNGLNLPASIDWTTKGVVNPVRDQGQCGSCWAFATTANSESVWAIYKGQLLDLSEQYLVDCAKGFGYFNLGCNGGQPDSALKYMINNGQCYESSYPYTAQDGTCQKCTSAGVKFSSCYDVTPNDQLSLKAAVSKQPVVIAIEADTRYFQSYSSGILTDVKCGTTLDHAVEIVGYGTDNGVKYWKVRNSWSDTWGEDGYFRIARSDSTNDIGICGLAAEPSFISI
jgi:C1A family cysteine protease